MCSCFGLRLGIIEPASFVIDNKKFKRASMDYFNDVELALYASFDDLKGRAAGRIILLDTKAETSYLDFRFMKNDIILVGKESSGVPDNVFNQCNHSLSIPMIAGKRSLNVAISAAIVVSEALRQLNHSCS